MYRFFVRRSFSLSPWTLAAFLVGSLVVQSPSARAEEATLSDYINLGQKVMAVWQTYQTMKQGLRNEQVSFQEATIKLPELQKQVESLRKEWKELEPPQGYEVANLKVGMVFDLMAGSMRALNVAIAEQSQEYLKLSDGMDKAYEMVIKDLAQGGGNEEPQLEGPPGAE